MRPVPMLLGLAIIAGIAMGFVVWSGLAPEGAHKVLSLYGMAAVAAAVVMPKGKLVSIRSQFYCMAASAAVFLAVDLLVWRHIRFMPSVKFVRGGFPPAEIMGLFLGPIYRALAVPTPRVPRLPSCDGSRHQISAIRRNTAGTFRAVAT